MSNHTYITYSEVIGSKPTEETLLSLLKTVNKETAFGRLSMVNNLLALFPPDETEKFAFVQRVLCQSLLNREIYQPLQRFVENISLVDRPIFHRQQVLYLMKRILLEGTTQTTPLADEVETKVLGEMCLMLNELLVTEEQENQTSSDNPLDPNESEKVMNGLMAQLLPSMELMNPSEMTRSLFRIRQYIKLFDAEFLETFDDASLSAFLESVTGVAPETFFQMVIEVDATYLQYEPADLIRSPEKFNVSKSSYFSNLNHSEKEVENFYRLTTKTFGELEALVQASPLNSQLLPQYDFTVFRQFPLFHLSADILTPIDITFLLEKVSSSFYYTILNSLNESNVDPRPFFKAWGNVFEKHVNNTFRGIYPENSNRFHPNLFFDSKTEMEAFDGTLEYPNSLITMEYKGGLLNTTAKYSGDVNVLVEEMGKKFGRSKDGAIQQLATKIELLFHSDSAKRKRIRNLEFGHIKSVFPVLIANELSLRFGLTHFRLRKWFEEEMKTRKIDPSVSVKPLMILTIEDLENLYPYLAVEDFSMLDFMRYYAPLEYIRFPGPEHWYEPLTSLTEVFYRFRKDNGIEFRPNNSIQEAWACFMDSITALFKPEAFEPKENNA